MFFSIASLRFSTEIPRENIMNTDWQSYFTFLPLRFTFRAQEDFPVPAYLGAMLRGAFGYAFRREVCLTRKGKQQGLN